MICYVLFIVAYYKKLKLFNIINIINIKYKYKRKKLVQKKITNVVIGQFHYAKSSAKGIMSITIYR